MSLKKSWIKAKKYYDSDLKQNLAERGAIEKEIKALTKAAESIHKKEKIKVKFGLLLADPVLIRMEAPQLVKPLRKIKDKQDDLAKLSKLKSRKTFGAEPAFDEIDKVFKVGRKLIEAGVKDKKKWEAWYKLARSGLKKCATAEKKFDNWIGRPSSSSEEFFDRKFKSLFHEMRRTGSPMLQIAGSIIKSEADPA
ncbi:hypothetical protein [Tateyamaria sp.]|uniref:hypothetical protein n=1 Tax=Tateyamaria sp. TaxID=1929288 RepID=UPI00329C4421